MTASENTRILSQKAKKNENIQLNALLTIIQSAEY
jgi:hypothetical protein